MNAIRYFPGALYATLLIPPPGTKFIEIPLTLLECMAVYRLRKTEGPVMAIKMVRHCTGYPLRESKDIVDAIWANPAFDLGGEGCTPRVENRPLPTGSQPE